MADATTSSTDSPELVAQKRLNAALEQQVIQLERQKKIVDALFPTFPEGAKGTIALEGQPIETRLLAYRQINRAAEEIAARIRRAASGKGHDEKRDGRKPLSVIIHDAAALAGLKTYRAFADQLDHLLASVRHELELGRKALAPGAEPKKEEGELEVAAVAGLALQAAPAILKSLTSLAGLFRQDVTLKNIELTIADSALVVDVCGRLAEHGVVVFYPSVVPPDAASSSSAILRHLEELSDLKLEMTELASLLEVAQKGETAAKLVAITDARTRLTALAASVDAFRNDLVKAEGTSGATALSKLLQGESLAPVTTEAHILSLRVAGASGSSEVSQGGIVHSSKRLFSGGVMVEFALFDAQGRVADAATLPFYSGLVEVEEGKNRVNLTDPIS